MSKSQADGRWEGSLKDGQGAMKPAHASEIPFSLATRFEGKQGSNPEEMIGAALAGCFSMALAAELGKAGLTPTKIATHAEVKLDKAGDGFEVSGIALTCDATVPGADAAKFEQIAQATKKACPISKALAGVKEISLQAKLSGLVGIRAGGSQDRVSPPRCRSGARWNPPRAYASVASIA